MQTNLIAYSVVLSSPVADTITKTFQVETLGHLITSLKNLTQSGWHVERISRIVGTSEALTPEETAKLKEAVPAITLATVGVDFSAEMGGGSYSFSSGIKR